MPFTIHDVALIHGINAREKNGEFYADCPFCGNKNSKFSYVVSKGEKRNIFHCWVCGESGNAIDLHTKLSDGDYTGEEGRKKACREIFSAIDGNIEFEKKKFEFENSYKPSEEVEKKPVQYCSKVFRKMLKMLDLKESHRNNLKKRGLPDKVIDRYKFKSTPSHKEAIQICKELSKKFDLNGVWGFFKNKYGQWDMAISGEGFFCPVYDGTQLVGFQIRLDIPIDKTKYVWFSSAGRECGCSSGGPSTILPGTGNLCIITEGILKATIVYELLNGVATVIGVPGINSYKSIGKHISENPYNLIIEAYDMDKAVRTSDVKEQKKTDRIKGEAEKLRNFISSFDIPVQAIKWDIDKEGYWLGQYKGLDDYLLIPQNRKKMLNFLKKKEESQTKLNNFFKMAQ